MVPPLLGDRAAEPSVHPKKDKDRSIRRVTRPSTVAAAAFFASRLTTRNLPGRVQALCDALVAWNAAAGDDTIDVLAPIGTPEHARRLAVTSAVMIHADKHFFDVFKKIFQRSLNQRRKTYDAVISQDDDEGNIIQLMNETLDDAKYRTLFYNLLHHLGWIRRSDDAPSGILLQQTLHASMHACLQDWIRTTVAGEFERDDLFPHRVQPFVSYVFLPWVQRMLLQMGERHTSNNSDCDMTDSSDDRKEKAGDEVDEADRLLYNHWQPRIEGTAAECFCKVRMNEMFEIVADYPDSDPAVKELRDVLDITKMQFETGQALKSSFVRRLLHSGAETSQIIDVYINTIKVLRIIDSSDRLLKIAAEPVRSYLRKRRDTVRCIITSMTDAEIGGDLYEELRRQDVRPLEHAANDSDDEEDEDEEPGMDWRPPPPITQPKGTFFAGCGSNGKGNDILSMLVSIYGSKELFVNEYRLMLADKLLANIDYNTDKEVHTLELLKLRFGEMSMRNCEIMIKDIDDSKRIIANIHSRMTEGAGKPAGTPQMVDATIISHIFWPALQKEQLQHHPRIQSKIDEFGSEYIRLKNPRRLSWMNRLGVVQLELDVIDEDTPDGIPIVETKEFSCSPLQATLVSHFEDKDGWTAAELAEEMTVPQTLIVKNLNFWTNKRVLKRSLINDEVFIVASTEHLMQGGDDDDDQHARHMMDDDGDRAISASAQEEEEMEAYESYIIGMLTNLGQLPLERIHNMLKMFVTGSDLKYDKTPQQLSVLLHHLCKKDKLERGPDGQFKLKK